MFDKKKYVLQRVARYSIATVMLLTAVNQTAHFNVKNIPFTEEDIKTNQSYISEIHEIKQTTPIFKNKELYNHLINQGINISTPSKVKEITISTKLSNNDFSDLKYFENLLNLRIENNDIDLSNIKYNYNLINLEIKNSKISNTTSIPNSVYNLLIEDSKIDNDKLAIPYNTKYLTITNTPFNNLYLKNPMFLKRLNIIGNCFLDIDSIKDCQNLEQLKLLRVPNVKNSHILESLSSLTDIELDDYASIWLSKDTYYALNLNSKNIYNEILRLDVLALDIVKDCKTEEEQIKAISTYILKKLSYDEDYTKQELKDYNNNPINYALNNKEAICINYASLFTALTNRIGIDSYQIYSDSHTWNMFYKDETPIFIDLSVLDTKTIIKVLNEYGTELNELPINKTIETITNGQEDTLYHYNLTLEELLQNSSLSKFTCLPSKNINMKKDIGYVGNYGVTIDFANKLYYIEYSKLNTLIIILATLSFFITLSSKNLKDPLLMSPEETKSYKKQTK